MEDQREGNTTIPCDVCGKLNKDGYVWCYSCGQKIDQTPTNIMFGYKAGKKTWGEKEYGKIQEYKRTHAADLLQPTYYDKHEKKSKLNKDFVKLYGDPFKKTGTGKAVRDAEAKGLFEIKGNG